ncbi:MAG: glycerol-3-phosphate dehydrogenase/oxidase [Thermoflexus sp.]|uniref:glycerol-3-phosphate dehydrogenase/oxidase n=1 Tax=Thermoflexus sp. TaxID=1969742 RepID=UPI0025DA274E|nr:glycerol-3-phosphate dehydrogenase/oxidase [Thermoflexus sp.]MCS6962808.1 glycerol-3-phosphate dehydrogenase/oxidase [Thermoflexus sp.]MDW8186076.1 glycerol-3-phosphate dehydrogenase/oxidase [Anaerolineae bacterium]
MPLNREEAWLRLDEPWDLLIIGGGITGAGLLEEATRQGFRAVLLEQRDFAWGTSSRSGKMVHGGLRYLRQGQVRTTWHSVREREHLLRAFPGLIQPLGFLMPLYRDDPIGRPAMAAGLWIYDGFAGRRGHCYLRPDPLLALAPHLRREGLRGGYAYRDALTDDARLVLRLILNAVRRGAAALNYARVEDFLQTRSGAIEGVVVRDQISGRETEVRARATVNATGAWADQLRGKLGRPPRLRLLRGSHLVLPGWRLPLAQGIILLHPRDHRPLYVLPWEGMTLAGTTDVDHDQDLAAEPVIRPEEFEYLLIALQRAFPYLDLSAADVTATFSGVRAVIGTGREQPSREPRDHAVWEERILTVTGGKLTTFRVMARDALRALRRRLPTPSRPPVERMQPETSEAAQAVAERFDPALGLRLLSRYDPEALPAFLQAPPEEQEPIPRTDLRWAELRWIATHEAVVHLDDLLLRRTRLGFQWPNGALPFLERYGARLRRMLSWEEDRWARETERYRRIWEGAYRPPM